MGLTLGERGICTKAEVSPTSGSQEIRSLLSIVDFKKEEKEKRLEERVAALCHIMQTVSLNLLAKYHYKILC